MFKRIAKELERHVPFTAFGALTGIIIMVIIVFGDIPFNVSRIAFYTLHPIHVVLSALTTTAMFMKYSKGKIWLAILIGYTGSIGIATISDAIIPDLAASLFPNVEPVGAHVPPFMSTDIMPIIGIPIWLIVNSGALIGIAIGYWKQTTKFPHAGHVLLSTWASLFRFLEFWAANWISLLPFIFLFLFLAVWIPCCTSDIVYPLLFVRKATKLTK